MHDFIYVFCRCASVIVLVACNLAFSSGEIWIFFLPTDCPACQVQRLYMLPSTLGCFCRCESMILLVSCNAHYDQVNYSFHPYIVDLGATFTQVIYLQFFSAGVWQHGGAGKLQRTLTSGKFQVFHINNRYPGTTVATTSPTFRFLQVLISGSVGELQACSAH